MKTSIYKKSSIALVIISGLFLSGCGINSGLINQFTANVSNTNVVLQKANFKVLGTVTGNANDTYIFGIGGNKQNLVAQAKQKMLDNAKLDGTSKAIINVTVEEHCKLILIYWERTISVQGTVIEFNE